jgi:signal transduction histidine kinase
LFVSAAVWSIAILVVAGFVLSTIQRRVTERGFDERLQVYVQTMAANIAVRNENNVIDPFGLGDPRFSLPLSGWYWQVTRSDVDPPDITTSISLFGGRLPRIEEVTMTANGKDPSEGYVTGPDERRLRMLERSLEMPDGAKYLVQIAANSEEIEANVDSFRWAMTVSFALLALALGVTTAFQVRFGLLPLARLSNAIGAIRRGAADRIDGRYPDDLAPLAGEVNLLIDANREILERARTQVGNLAHALKTPLSVLVNEAANDDTSLAGKVREQTTLMRDQVNWYLDRARAAARAGSIGIVSDVEPVIRGLERAFLKIYADKALAFEIAVPEDLKFRGERQDLEEMIGNLMDNAAKWADRAVRVSGRLMTEETQRVLIEIEIDDDGPGLPPETRADVIKRGRRLDESKPGSGLGLSIVADLAALYGGSLALDVAEIGGLRVRLRLPGA